MSLRGKTKKQTNKNPHNNSNKKKTNKKPAEESWGIKKEKRTQTPAKPKPQEIESECKSRIQTERDLAAEKSLQGLQGEIWGPVL